MELLVYVRNHGGRPSGSTYVGASVGSAPSGDYLDTMAPMTSMAEFRIAAGVDDPVGELRRAVLELFEVVGEDRYRRPIYYSRPHSALKVLLEPGFDTPDQVAGELAEMLALCSPRVVGPGRQVEARPVATG